MAGTSTKTKVIGIRVPVALMAELEALAKTRGVTVSALCLEGVQAVVNRGPEVVAPQSSKARPSMQQIRRPAMKSAEPTSAVLDRSLAILMGEPTPDGTKPRPERHHLNEVTRPSMTRIEPKPVAAVLPVTGTEFPARPVYLRGQDPAKGKGKR